MVVSCVLAVFLSGINFDVDTANISNLMIDANADALQFWFRTHKVGLSVIKYSEESMEAGHGDGDYQEVEEMYVYSAIDLNNYNCGVDTSCVNTVDDLSAVWNTLLVASCVSAMLSALSWLLAAPCNFYPCLFNTKVYQRGVQEKKKLCMWFVQPTALTYLLATLNAIVFGVQFNAFFKYLRQLPSNQDMYALSLHFLNSDPTICSLVAPCTFSYDDVNTFHHNGSQLLVGAVYAALVVAFMAASHRLQLASTRWDCCSGRRGLCAPALWTSRTPVPSAEEESELELSPSSQGQGQGQHSYSPHKGEAVSSAPEAVLVCSEVSLMSKETLSGGKWTEVDLHSEHSEC